MPKLVNPAIPLICNLCPKMPTFSDISHLLTHVSSKAHLSSRFNLTLRSSEPDARAQLEIFENWYAEYSIEDLLSDRLAAKEQKKTNKRIKASLIGKIKDESLDNEDSNSDLPREPLMHTWAAGPPVFRGTSPYQKNSNIEDVMYATPTARRHLPNFGTQLSPRLEEMVLFNAGSIKLDRPAQRPTLEPESAAATLKGVYWPGMDLFDSATAEMKRKRNQKKDGSVLEQMKVNSASVEPNEWIFNAAGELERTRYIFDDSTDSSPAKSESDKIQSPKRRRTTRRTTAVPALGDVSTNAPRLTARAKGKGKVLDIKAGSKKVSMTMNPAEMSYSRFMHPNPLSLANMSYTPNLEEDEEFRLTIGNMGNKRAVTVLRDVEIPSPDRTESPLEHHRFDLFNDQIPGIQSVQDVRSLESHFASDDMLSGAHVYTLSPIRTQANSTTVIMEHFNRAIMQPIHQLPMAIQSMRMQPIYGGPRPQDFQHDMINPLLSNSQAQTLGYGPFQQYHEFQPYNNDAEYKQFVANDPFDGVGGQQHLPNIPYPDMVSCVHRNGMSLHGDADGLSYHI